MWFQYFIEAWGIIIILYAKLLTDADPYVLGFTYFACLMLAKGITTGYFSPASTVASYFLGHIKMDDFIYNLIAHLIGTCIVIITFIPVHKYVT